MRIKLTTLLVSAGVALGALTGSVVTELAQPEPPREAYCPSEDSCWVDYDGANDRWVIHEEHVDDAPDWVTAN